MLRITLACLMITFFIGCHETKKINYNGKKLLGEKCQSCHNLDMPPKTYVDEKAPPIMAVAFHVSDFIKAPNPSERTGKAIAFVCDYVINPSKDKSFCDKESLKSYGVMPSQKGKVTQDELKAIATYMFSHYTKDNFLETMKNIQKLAMMPKGEQLTRKLGCFSCHGKTIKKVGPSFHTIAKRNTKNTKQISDSIKNGSKGKYKEAHNIPMPKFNKLNHKDIQILRQCVLKQ